MYQIHQIALPLFKELGVGDKYQTSEKAIEALTAALTLRGKKFTTEREGGGMLFLDEHGAGIATIEQIQGATWRP